LGRLSWTRGAVSIEIGASNEEASVKCGKNGLIDDLKRPILTMELDPYQDLDEVGLSERYGLSRTPVREIKAAAK
jgi:transcriptional regulator GlxA family with amidase domain